MPGAPSPLGTVLYRAGAGAGKTHTLVHRIYDVCLHFFERHQRWPRLVCCTYTRKATQELGERLLSLALEKGNTDLAEYCAKGEGILISTIHGVCSRFLALYGQGIDLDPSFEVPSEGEERRLIRVLVRDLLTENPQAAQLREYLRTEELILILQTLEKSPEVSGPKQAFSREDYSAVLSEVLSDAGKEAADLLKHFDALDLNSQWSEYLLPLRKFVNGNLRSVEEQLSELRAWLGSGKPRAKQGKVQVVEESLDQEVKVLRDRLRFLEDPSMDPIHWNLLLDKANVLAELAHEFRLRLRHAKRVRGWVSFSDLENLTVELVRKSPQAQTAFAQSIDYWLIDEYQDTSPLQEEILFSLISDKPFFLVGDPQQSIYFFRGARSEVFRNREAQISEIGGAVESLQSNWRSRPHLVYFFNTLFGAYKKDFVSMEPVREPGLSIEGSLRFLRAPAEDVELRSLRAHVMALLKTGARPEQIAVLARDHKTLKKVGQYFFDSGLAVQQHTPGSFAAQREVQDALSLLIFLFNPHDNLNLVRVLRAPWFRLDDGLLVAWLGEVREGSHWERLRKFEHPSLSRLREGLAKLARLGYVEAWKSLIFESGFVDLSHVYDSSGVWEANIWKLVRKIEDIERLPGRDLLESVREIMKESASEENEAVSALEPDRIQLMTVHRSKGLQFDHVIVPQAHRGRQASQGSEMLVLDERTGKFGIKLRTEEEGTLQPPPAHLIKAHKKSEEGEEHLRLFYVALTRARESLLISSSKPAETGSWLENFPLSLELGDHHGEGFQYDVVDEIPDVSVEAGTKTERITLREPLMKEISKASVALSVTRALGVEQILPAARVSGMARAVGRGTWSHRIFESLRYDWQLNPAWLHSEDRAALGYLRDLEELPLRQILEVGEAEWGFNLALKEGLSVPGQIDLWGIVEGRLWVVDYKTGSSTDLEKAFRQLSFYAFAVREMKGPLPTTLAVILPYEKQTVLRPLDEGFSVGDLGY